MNKNPIITWQSVLTDHQAFTYEALGSVAQVKVISYVVSIEDKDRKKQGWLDSIVLSSSRFLIPHNNFYSYCFGAIRNNRNSIHIFAAPFMDWRFIPCMLYTAHLNVKFYIISEPYSPCSEGYLNEVSQPLGALKVGLRPYLYRLYGLMLAKSVAGVFAISQLAYLQFKSAGFQDAKLFRFGYFVPRKVSGKNSNTGEFSEDVKPIIKAIYVGSLIKRKGVDILFDVCEALQNQGSKIVIDVYGPGNTDWLPINLPNFVYKGVIPFGEAQEVMSRYDFAIVPSRHDGWGVAVNEAILAGIPVICSNEVGASALIDRFDCGVKFKSRDVSELLCVLKNLENNPSLLKDMKQRAINSGQFIDPSVAANYMFSLFNSHPSKNTMIDSPWYKT